MSTRQIRKYKETRVRKDEGSDVPLEEFEPGFVKNRQTVFSGLILTSDSEHEDPLSTNESNTSSNEQAVRPVARSGKQKKKRKNKILRNSAVSSTPRSAGPSSDSAGPKSDSAGPSSEPARAIDDIDEIDQVVAEINMIFGEPNSSSPHVEDLKDDYNPLRVNTKFFDVNDELTRRFGPAEDGERGRRQRPRLVKRLIIQYKEGFNQYKFSVKGLKMVLINQDTAGIKYFKFEHGPEYVKNMTKFIMALMKKYEEMNFHELHVFPNNTIEAILENNDVFYTIAYENGRPDMEETIYFLQGLFHPNFNLSDDKVRLEYLYVENRMFHVALLKYLHLLTNRACHRTALEVAKLLLNLDPSDPLAVIFIIDVLAIRAREHKWLVELYKYWEHERHANHLFHMRFSYALALFQLASKSHSQEKMEEAKLELHNAMLDFPFVVLKLFECASQRNDAITSCNLFKNSRTPECLKELMMVYAKFIWPRWVETHVWKWFTETASSIVDIYNKDEQFRDTYEKNYYQRLSLFRTYPLQIKRHLSIITPMAKLLLDGYTPSVARTMSFNPYPNEGPTADGNNYLQRETVTISALLNVFNTLFPRNM